MKKLCNCLGAILTAFILVTVAHSSAHAVGISQVGQGLTISPLRTELVIAPGTVLSGNVTVYNNTAQDMQVSMSAEGFGVTNIQYDYSFEPGSALVQWVRFTPSIVAIAPGKSIDVSYTITTPLGAEPGGHYIALFATTSPPLASGEVVTQSRVGSLLYMTVDGNVTRQGNLLAVSVPWLIIDSARWGTSIQNAGSTHFRSNVQVTIRTLWNSDVATDTGSGLILTRSIRLLKGNVPTPTIPGIYKVAISATMGDKPTTYVTRLVIYMPPYGWFIVAVIGIYISIRTTHFIHVRRGDKKTTT